MTGCLHGIHSARRCELGASQREYRHVGRGYIPRVGVSWEHAITLKLHDFVRYIPRVGVSWEVVGSRRTVSPRRYIPRVGVSWELDSPILTPTAI